MAKSKSSKRRKAAKRSRGAAKSRRKPVKESRPKAARQAKASAKASRKRAKSSAKRTSTRRKATSKAKAGKSQARTRKSRPRAGSPKPGIQVQPRMRPVARPTLDRARRMLDDSERLGVTTSSLNPRDEDRTTLSARAGHDALRHELERHNESGPRLTAGDVDAKWQDAYAVGDEAPGGDNPTPDQDRVDDIGRALGINYQDDQELMGGDEVAERDKHRWELDPASSDDWPHDKDED